MIVHALAATVWTGGHLVLDLGLFPRALRAQSAAQVRAFEEVFEPLGLTALAIQVLTGLGMDWIYLPGFQGLFRAANPIGMLVVLLRLCGFGLARAGEVIRLCGPSAVGFIRTTARQSCLYSSDTRPAPPDPNSAHQP
ncbi:hypothetical protein KBZ15_09725 [Cyanobium sp. BA20m-p-22]|uniref:hypothetical protein n=1 Tax=unclassified Cyanobium TaxID=2627006 RepID=UPI0020CD3F0B|nr:MULTISPECIES: hypothetical protein [unclassified Cyanobium]MCP9910183.1 hypothetical protein [Cyanobium sp. BA20m-p-22]MCP9913113.1 hypothetical protein [Cyanobium sp. BA20m-14]